MSEGTDDWMASGWTELGHGVAVKPTTAYSGPPDEVIGYLVRHRHDDGEWCVGSFTLDVPAAAGFPGPKWTLHSHDPLHVEPSIHRVECGLHGFVRDGQWVPA